MALFLLLVLLCYLMVMIREATVWPCETKNGYVYIFMIRLLCMYSRVLPDLDFEIGEPIQCKEIFCFTSMLRISEDLE